MDTNAGTGWPDSTDEGAGHYSIRVQGHLSAHWAARFEGLGLRHDSDGTTVIHGPIADQAALHGVLQQVRDLGLELVSLARAGPAPPPGQDRDEPL